MVAASNLIVLPLAYAAMWAVQAHGVALVGLIHGAEARRAAEVADSSDVSASTPYEALCTAYDAHHYDSMSNCMHAVGYVLSFRLLAHTALGTKGVWPRVLGMAWLPPTWYLYAWAGHLALQADVPAVFTYGTTLRGWATGETCALVGFLQGRLISGAREWAATAVVVLSHVMSPLQMI